MQVPSLNMRRWKFAGYLHDGHLTDQFWGFVCEVAMRSQVLSHECARNVLDSATTMSWLCSNSRALHA